MQEEIIKKLKSGVVVFVIGINGETREICPLDPGKVNDDSIREILNDVKKRLEPSSITLSKPYPIPTSSSGWLLVFYAEQVSDGSKEISLPGLV